MKKNKEDIIIELSEKATKFAMTNNDFLGVNFEEIPYGSITYYFQMSLMEQVDTNSLSDIANLAKKSGINLDPIELNLFKKSLEERYNYVNARITKDALYISVQDDDREPLLEFEVTDSNPKPVITYSYTTNNIKLQFAEEYFGEEAMMAMAITYLRMTFNIFSYLVKPKEKVTKSRIMRDELTTSTRQVPQKPYKKQKRYLSKKVYIVEGFEQYVPNKDEDKRQYTRHTESWDVCGHWRTYKSGKRVYIPSQVRGDKTKEPKPKQVKIANMGGDK